MSHVLITNNHFREIKGSELVTLELAEAFLALGWDVTVYSNLYMPPIADEVVALQQLHPDRILYVPDDPYMELHGPYDLVWVQHSVLPDTIIDLLTTAHNIPVVWHHMSSTAHEEMPLLADIERKLASVVSAKDPATVSFVETFLEKKKATLFENPAPDRFCDFVYETPKRDIPKYLIVSNHPPAELLAAADMLRADGIEVDMHGDASEVVRITPEILARYDAIVTIGKTVQYASVMGLPVYVYDHYGGEGWLMGQPVFEESRVTGFSGAATKQKRKPQTIAEELRSGIDVARKYAREKRDVNAERWRISRVLEQRINEVLSVRRSKKQRLTVGEAARFRAFNEFQRGYYRTLAWYKDEQTKNLP